MPETPIVVGYVDQLSVQPEDGLRLMVDCAAETYTADVVRLLHGDTNPQGPGFICEEVSEFTPQTLRGRRQPLRTGSYVEVPAIEALGAAGVTLCAWVWPTTPDEGSQGLVTQFDEQGRGVGLAIGEDGHPELVVGGARLRSQTKLRPRIWQFVVGTYDRASSNATLCVKADTSGSRVWRDEGVLDRQPFTAATAALVIGGARTTDEHGAFVGAGFNGKLEAPAVFDRALAADELEVVEQGARDLGGLVTALDFARDISTRRVHDVGPRRLDARTVNMPARGVTGRRWDGSEVDWRRAPEQYAAIHFHSDDLDDAGWDADLEWTVPDGLPSGMYAFRLRAGEASHEQDCVPFIVRPPKGTTTARIAFVAPTFTYLAYANEQQLGREEIRKVFEGLGASFVYPLQDADRFIVENELRSLYDRHRDGSGVFYASWLRPLMTMRPTYRFPYLMQGRGAPHGLGADLHLLHWMSQAGYEFDVLTDADLHAEGADLLRPYQAVVSGSHHEYWTAPMLEALNGYLDDGGRFMYLSGNGLYWVTGLEHDERHTVEIRRCGASTRTWEAEPGEWHLSTTGELGGLWRFRGRAPQTNVGVGFSAEGLGRGRPYRRTEASGDPRAAFIFEGVGDGLIGDFENLVVEHGPAGWEIDRHDLALGSPAHSLVVATADGFSDEYQHVVDEVLHADSRQGGTVEPRVRADMVFYECPNGGAVFSVGSIGWCGSLFFDDHDNDVAKLTANVLTRFSSDEPFDWPGDDE
jgi:N,N-dimethylformamidase